MLVSYIADFSTKHEVLYAQCDGLHDLLPPDVHEEEFEEEPMEEVEPEEEPAKEKCPHCSFETNLPNVFKLHTKSFRLCSVCNVVFCGKRSAQNLKVHEKTHLPEKVHECEICKKSFKFASVLKTHYIRTACGRQVDY